MALSITMDCSATLYGHEDRVWCVAWNNSGTLLASCSTDKTIKIWGQEGEKWICKQTLSDGHVRTVRTVSWSPCDKMLVSTSFDGTTTIWDTKNGQFESAITLEGHENEVKSAAWSPSGQFLATCGRDKRVWIWTIDDEEDYECVSVLSVHTQDVKNVAWHPHKDILASCSYDDTVRMFAEAEDDWESFDTLVSHTSTVWGLSFSSDGDRLVTCSDDKSVKIWKCYPKDNKEGIIVPGNHGVWKCVCTLSGYHHRAIYDVQWNRSNGYIATACGDNSIRIFTEDLSSDLSAPSFNLAAELEDAHKEDVNSICWNPKQGDLLASASDDGSIKLWRLSSEV